MIFDMKIKIPSKDNPELVFFKENQNGFSLVPIRFMVGILSVMFIFVLY